MPGQINKFLAIPLNAVPSRSGNILHIETNPDLPLLPTTHVMIKHVVYDNRITKRLRFNKQNVLLYVYI